jgi:hypothetical protein
MSYEGKDNYGKPKSIFLKQLADGDDAFLFEQCKHFIWLSAYAANNPRSDYHWQCDACYDECDRRGKVKEIYSVAHKQVSQG